MNQALTLYQNAKHAIAEYKTVDEVKDFRDKALAVEAYAKQANDFELERDAAIARVRAERKCGELLGQLEKGAGTGRGNKKDLSTGENVLPDSPYQSAKTAAGLSDKQASQWQKLAQVPEREFEEAINLPGAKPSTNHILKKDKEPDPPRMDGTALWWWGRLVDIERDKINTPLSALVAEMTDAMKSDADRIIPKLKRWINDYE